MHSLNESRTMVSLTPSQVVGYVEEMILELADLAARHERTELARSLSIVAVQAGAERRRLLPEPS